MARDQRTRLNAELAHQYNGSRKRGAAVTPGRSSLTGELIEKSADDVEGEVAEEQEGAEQEEQQVADREPKKSLFELPRKEPSRQPLLSSTPTAPAASAAPAAPAATKPKGPRRG